MTEARQAAIVAEITTTDEAGKHFTERYAQDDLAELEEAGLIEFERPIHAATSLPYAQEYWSVMVTDDGRALVDAYEDRWYDEAERRVEKLFADDAGARAFCLADWPEGDGHWRWLIVADVEGIRAWIAAGGE